MAVAERRHPLRHIAGDEQKALEVMPMLKRMYNAEDNLFEIFTLDNATATFQAMSDEKK